VWTRTDPIINFNWAAGAPGPMPVDVFSARWTGTIQPYATETYTVELETQGGVELSIGGQLLINQLANEADTTFTATFAAQKAQLYDIALKYKDTSGSAKVRLRWSSTSTVKRIVPQAQLDWDNSAYGASVTYFNANNFTNQSFTRVEPVVASNWGSSAPGLVLGTDNFSSIWRARLVAPYTGKYKLCSDSDESTKAYVNGTLRLDVGTANSCGAEFDLTAGTHDLQVDHREVSGSARLRLDWEIRIGSPLAVIVPREMIRNDNLLLPAAYTPPTNGLLVTFYDERDFNWSLGENQTSPKAFRRIAANVDYDWGNSASREEWQILTSNNDLSGRWTGTLTAPCTGVTEFETTADDSAKLWLNNTRVTFKSSSGASTGAFYMTAGTTYPFKFDWDQGTGTANAKLRWKPCGQGSYVIVPQSAFTPGGGRTLGGFVRSGGDNGSGTDYFVWKTPTNVGELAAEVTTDTPGKWGLGGVTMMVPSFAPDASKLVFVDGDHAGGAGWRKGLSVFEFDLQSKVFKNRKSIVNTWPFGDVIKWPVFESDSRSVIYSASPPGTFCCVNGWTKYGYMAPTDYYETPGKLFSVDSQAANPTAVAMTKASSGERAVDANKAWQPTTLPVPAGGYRWMVFTSTRPYGNTLNLAGQQDYTNTGSYSPMLNYADLQSQLWISAVDDRPSDGQDRSHPGFWLPNQNYNETPSQGFINERGFWALEPCRPTGSGAESLCDVAEDCCGAQANPPTATCRLDTPISAPATRHCKAKQSQNSCVLPGGACGTTDECCSGTVCVEGACKKPPSLDTYSPANFDRVYTADCGYDAVGEWHFFDWKVETPPTGSIVEFYVQTSNDPDDFAPLPPAPSDVDIPGTYLIARIDGVQNSTVWSGADVGELFADEEVLQGKYVRITMRLTPNIELTESPVIKDFRMTYSCPPAQ
jgi:hypothetical protein